MNSRQAIRKASGGAPVKRRKRRPAEEIKDRVLRAAREEFKNRGYAGATTAAIAKRADVAEIQMFRYFPSKEDLFRESIVAQLKDHFRTFTAKHNPEAIDEESIEARARLYTAELQMFLNDHAKMLISLLFAQTYAGPALGRSRTGLGALQAFFDECATMMSRRAQALSSADPGTIVRVAFGALLGCITYWDWLFPGGATDETAIRGAITDFVLAGIAPHSDLGGSRRRFV